MTDKKISELANITGANLADSDEFVVVDSSASETKAITRSELGLGINKLGYNGTQKIITTPTGVDVTGTVTADGLTVVGNGTKYNAITINGGHVSDGGNDYGLTINSFEPAITMLDRTTGAGSVQLFGTSNGGLWIVGDTTNDGTIGHSTNTTDFLVAKFEPINTIFYTSGAESMRINSSGNVGIGTTAPLSKLHVNTVAAGYGITVAASSQTSNEFQLGIDSSSNFAIYDTTAAENRMVISPAGNVGIGTSAPVDKFTVSGGLVRVENNNGELFSGFGGVNNNSQPNMIVSQSRGTVAAPTETQAGDRLLGLLARGHNGTTYTGFSASLQFHADGSGSAGGTYVGFHTAPSGSSTRAERMRIAGAGVVYTLQAAQTSKAAAATLTIAELLTGIIQYTGTAATLTLPTGTDIEGGVSNSLPTNMSFDFSIINTGSGTATVGANGNTTVGGLTVAAGASGLFRVRKTGTNAYTIYRIS